MTLGTAHKAWFGLSVEVVLKPLHVYFTSLFYVTRKLMRLFAYFHALNGRRLLSVKYFSLLVDFTRLCHNQLRNQNKQTILKKISYNFNRLYTV